MSKSSNRSARKPVPAAPAPATARPLLWGGVVALVVAAGIVAYLAWPAAQEDAAVAPSGDEPGLVTQVESLYNDIYVYRQPNGYYVLSFGAKRLHYIESIVNPKDELDLPVYYTQSMTAGLAYAAEPRRRRDHRPRRRPHRLVPPQIGARART